MFNNLKPISLFGFIYGIIQITYNPSVVLHMSDYIIGNPHKYLVLLLTICFSVLLIGCTVLFLIWIKSFFNLKE